MKRVPRTCAPSSRLHAVALQPARAVRDTGDRRGPDLSTHRSTIRPVLMTLREHTKRLSRSTARLRVHSGPERRAIRSCSRSSSISAASTGVPWMPSGACRVPAFDGDARESSSIRCPLPGEAPPYSPRRHQPGGGRHDRASRSSDRASGRSAVFYAPGLGGWTDELVIEHRGARRTSLLIDGTLWEGRRAPPDRGAADKTGREMGHLAQTGDDGSARGGSRRAAPRRKILIHINNTNPILDEASPGAREARTKPRGSKSPTTAWRSEVA